MTDLTVRIKDSDLMGRVMYIRATGISLNVFPEEHLNGSEPARYTEAEIAIAQAALLAS
jgi:hypothetical protein